MKTMQIGTYESHTMRINGTIVTHDPLIQIKPRTIATEPHHQKPNWSTETPPKTRLIGTTIPRERERERDFLGERIFH